MGEKAILLVLPQITVWSGSTWQIYFYRKANLWTIPPIIPEKPLDAYQQYIETFRKALPVLIHPESFLATIRTPVWKNIAALSFAGWVGCRSRWLFLFSLTPKSNFSISQSRLWLGSLSICRWWCPSMFVELFKQEREKKSPLSFSSLRSCQGASSWSHTSASPNTSLALFQALQSRRTKYFD